MSAHSRRFSPRCRIFFLFGCLSAVVSPNAFGQAANATEHSVTALIRRAGNADEDAVRLGILKQLGEMPDASEELKADADRLIAEIERWIGDDRLEYFSSPILETNDYDFGIAKDSPLYPIADIYRARMLLWVTLEYGGYWSDPEVRSERFKTIRPIFEKAREAFPENKILRMYLGEPIPPKVEYGAVPGAPDWAVHQREGLERLADIITWWIDNRMQANGEYGGGWGDDCEMWRWWAPVLIGFDDPKIGYAQARFSEALMSQEHMRGGYTTYLYDVEHTSEDSSDAITPMMHLEPDSDVWSNRAKRLAELFETLWSGTNERGFLQFRSTYFSVDKVDPDPKKACDTVYHPRALQPALLYWQRTGDPWMGKLFTAWMDTWVDAAARSERGKPAGIVPSAIHWPDGGIGGLGENWWNPENHTSDPLYTWPSAMGQMTDTLLLAYHMTKDEKYLEPIRSMAEIRLKYLENPPMTPPEEGSGAWCASKLGGLTSVLAKYKLLTGSDEFDALLERDRNPYFAFRTGGEAESLVDALKENAAALRVNFAGYTSEVRYTDRVLRFPQIFRRGNMFEEGIEEIQAPNPEILYQTATGDPGSAAYFPMNAVRWLTPPREIAALVTDTGADRFSARLFHFGERPRSLAAEFYLLEPGKYVSILTPKDGDAEKKEFEVWSARTRVSFQLPPRRVCEVVVRNK